MCGVCINNYYKNATNYCEKCTNNTVKLKIISFGVVALVLIVLLWSQRKRIKRLRANETTCEQKSDRYTFYKR